MPPDPAIFGVSKTLPGQTIGRNLVRFGEGIDEGELITNERFDASAQLREQSRAAIEEFLQVFPRWRSRLGEAQKDLDTEFSNASNLLARAEAQNTPSMEIVQQIDRVLTRLRQDVHDNLDELGTEPPAIAVVPASVRSSFDSYLSERQQYEGESVASLGSLAQRYSRVTQRLLSEDARGESVKSRIAAVQEECISRIERGYSEFTQICRTAQEDFAPKWKEQQITILRDLLAPLGPDPIAAVVGDATGQIFLVLETALAQQLSRTREVFVPFWSVAKSQINSLEGGEGGEIAIGVLNRSLEQLEERGQMLSELAQLGLIVESIDHDYHVLFAKLEEELADLMNLVRDKPDAGKLISGIRQRAESINQKALLLSPMYRKESEMREVLYGGDVRDFLNALFTDNIKGKLEFEFSESFLAMRLTNVYKPVIFAAIANLVSNSIYWTSRGATQRRVKFTIVPGGFVVSDSGPGIAPRDRERVFEPFFTRRPYGRGLGLYITRTNLEAKGMQILVASEPQKRALSGANFIIRKRTIE